MAGKPTQPSDVDRLMAGGWLFFDSCNVELTWLVCVSESFSEPRWVFVPILQCFEYRRGLCFRSQKSRDYLRENKCPPRRMGK